MRWTYLFCSAALLPLAACANLTSISRETDIISVRDFDNKKDAKAIHLDAKQRLVFSDSRALCAEPSPDALSALAASVGGGLTAGPDSGSVAQAFTETAGSIGLRTQSITIMRDTLYRMCEAFHNYAVLPDDYVQLLQRSQDLTLGVLAIEQLTGVAMASQVALSGDANASAATALRTTQDMLQKATDDETNARAAKATADGKVKATEKEIEQLGSAPSDEKEKLAYQEKKDALDQQLARDQADAKAKGDTLKQAEEAKKVIERNREAAFADAHAAASGNAKFSQVNRAGLASDTTNQVANAVERIVATVIGKNHLVDNCVNYLIKDDNRSEQEMIDKRQASQAVGDRTKAAEKKKNMADVCAAVVTADITMRDTSNKAQAEAYKSYYKGPMPRPKPEELAPSPDKLTPPPSGVY